MFYTVKTPWLFRKIIFPSLVWEKPANEKILYLTFDDGPHPTATPFVLETLQRFHAKATFFCIGKNVEAHPGIYRRILQEGHRTGNHTYDHLNGWKTKDAIYFENIFEASRWIESDLFRPPYGKIKRSQVSMLKTVKGQWSPESKRTHTLCSFTVIMWSVLSGDFDESLPPERCLQNVLRHAGPGSIVVFHDSTKAWSRMSFALPGVLEHFSQQGYRFATL